MKKKILILTAIILAFVLTACGDITINIPEGLLDKLVATGTPTPTQEPDDPTGTPDPTEEVTPTPTEEVTPTPTEEMTPTPTEKPTPTPTEEPTPTPTEEPTPTPTEEPTPTPTKVPTKTPTKKPTPTLVVKPTKVPTLTPTPTLKDEDDPDNIFPTSEELWEKLFGCWAADNDRFVYFTYTDAGPSFLAGIWERPIPYNREAGVASKTVTNLGNGLYTLGITYPPNEENAADSQDLRPLSYTIMVDISMIDYRVIYVQAPDEEEMLEYTWMADSYSDAYDEHTSFEAPTLEEIQNLWRNISGYWYGPDNTYVVFDQMDSNTFLFDYGILETETRGYAYLEKIQTPIGAHPMRIVFYYPEHESELMGYLPREFVQLFLELDNIGKGNIAMKIGENGLWNTYIYAGW